MQYLCHSDTLFSKLTQHGFQIGSYREGRKETEMREKERRMIKQIGQSPKVES